MRLFEGQIYKLNNVPKEVEEKALSMIDKNGKKKEIKVRYDGITFEEDLLLWFTLVVDGILDSTFVVICKIMKGE